jgi:hypothetical protein
MIEPPIFQQKSTLPTCPRQYILTKINQATNKNDNYYQYYLKARQPRQWLPAGTSFNKNKLNASHI